MFNKKNIYTNTFLAINPVFTKQLQNLKRSFLLLRTTFCSG